MSLFLLAIKLTINVGSCKVYIRNVWTKVYITGALEDNEIEVNKTQWCYATESAEK